MPYVLTKHAKYLWLYDYQKKVSKQTKEIASLQKQLAAYANDTSEENRARIQKLNTSLQEAQENLQETQYDKYVKDQKKLLDDLYDEYETMLNERLDNIDALMDDMIDYTNANAADIQATIASETAAVGYTMSDEMSTIWSGAENVVSKYGDSFYTQLTTVNTALNMIRNQIANMKAAGDSIAAGYIAETTPETEEDPNAPTLKPEAKTEEPAKEEPASEKKMVKVVNGQWWLYKNGPKKGRTDSIVHKGETYEYLGEKNGYTKILYKGKERWFNSNGARKMGFAEGGFVAGLQKMAYQNGDDMLTFNTLKRGEAVFTERQYKQIEKLVNNVPGLQKLIDMNDLITSVGASSFNNGDTNVQVDVGGINIQHVENLDDFMYQVQRDGRFEKLIQSMTTDLVVGRQKLRKFKF